VPITLIDKEVLETFALLDSGASISIFRPEIAYQLGVEIESGEAITSEGISGRITVYLHNIKVEFEGFSFLCKIGFSEEYTASFNLLGRDNFFEQFLITFDERSRKVIVEEWE